MKKLYAILLFFAFASMVSAQAPSKSWDFGFGVNYPRMVNTATSPEMFNVGGYLSLQSNFSEYTSLRFKGKFTYMEFTYQNADISSMAGSGNFDLMYHFVPCQEVSPYMLVGFGGVMFQTQDSPNPTLNEEWNFDFQFNLGFGGRLKFSERWAVSAELDYHVVPTSSFDGVSTMNNTATAIGGYYDSYMSLDVGFNYYFGIGEPSQMCELYDGIADQLPDPIDYDRIEDIVKRNVPREVVKEVVVEKEVPRKQSSDNWVLVGVNFDFGSAKLRAEAYPILYHSAKVLLENPDTKVEIQGYTDNIGSEQANQRLSQQRAEAVKQYLVAKGVDAGRLEAVGYGEQNPVADNSTSDGRLLNRRIEFKVK